MQVPQAIFTSAARGQIKGYQLVATSEGIDRSLARELQIWSPSQISTDDPQQWTVNYYPVDAERVAVTRTVLGGPEYSGRGGTQVVTLILVLTNQQYAAYGNHAMHVVRTAMALGGLRLPADFPSRLPAFELPERPLALFKPRSHEVDEPNPVVDPASTTADCSQWSEMGWEDELLKQWDLVVNRNRRLAVVGAAQPRNLLQRLLESVPVTSRRPISFTTGLPPTLNRPFCIHFMPTINQPMRQWLRNENIQVFELPEYAVGLL